MELTTKQKVSITVVVVASSFAAGRYTVPQKVVTEVRTVEVEKKVEDKKQDVAKNTKKRTKTIETIKPNGEKVTETIVTETSTVDKKTDVKTQENNKIDTESKKEVVSATDKVTVSALAGIDIKSPSIVYGASVSKPVLGPIAVGLFGLTNGTVGASIGLSF